MRSLRLPFGDVEPTDDFIFEVRLAHRGMWNLGYVNHEPLIAKEKDSLGWYITITCQEDGDYGKWYAYYWGFMLGRRLHAVPTQSR